MMVRLSKRKDAREVEEAILSLGDEIHQMTKAEIGERLGYLEERIRLAMHRMGVEHDGHAAHPTQIPHGTPSGWSWHKCRCEVCVEARREYKRAERVRRLDGFDPDKYEHGRTETYQAGCDCEPCAAAMRSFLAARNDQSRRTARQHTSPWTGPDVEYAMRDDIPLAQIARDLGRTYAAVSNVRKAVAAGNHHYLELLGRA
ncbi:hypothetical protein [Nesterenkonia suensis]